MTMNRGHKSRLIRDPAELTSGSPDALRVWLDTNGLSAAEYAHRLKVAPETMSRWMQRRLYPSLVVRLAIEYTTGGMVPACGWGTA